MQLLSQSILYRIDSGMDLLEGAGKEGSVPSSASQQARSYGGSPLFTPALLLPMATSPLPSRVMHPVLSPSSGPAPLALYLSAHVPGSELPLALHSTGTDILPKSKWCF